MLGIPLRSDLPFFDVQVPLDGVTYTLEFRWNVRAAAWFMTVLDEQAETVLMAGLKLVLGAFIGLEQTGRQPPGVFLMLDTSGTNVDPGVDDLGDRVRLEYLTAADLASLTG